jgi:hypothetical protein
MVIKTRHNKALSSWCQTQPGAWHTHTKIRITQIKFRRCSDNNYTFRPLNILIQLMECAPVLPPLWLLLLLLLRG